MSKKPPARPEVIAAQCQGKFRYDTMALAQTVAKRQRRRETSRVMAYHCSICDGWHIGNKKPSSYCKGRRDD